MLVQPRAHRDMWAGTPDRAAARAPLDPFPAHLKESWTAAREGPRPKRQVPLSPGALCASPEAQIGAPAHARHRRPQMCLA
eukprot:1532547-Pyramimonas_sp.AAC.1